MPPVRNYRARTKYSLMIQGIIQNDYVRPPLVEIPDNEKNVIKTSLKEQGLI